MTGMTAIGHVNKILAVVLCCSVAIIHSLATEEHPLEQLIATYPDRVDQLFEKIDFNYPGLAGVKKAYEAGDLPKALGQFLRYHREKTLPQALIPQLLPARPDIIGLADDANEGIFTIQSKTYRQPPRVDGLFDWEDLGPNHDKEWAWMLNRHPHFEFLITTYLSTRNPRYLDTVSRHLIDWIPHYPPPDHMSFSTTWRALEAARRVMGSWLMVYSYVRSEKAISDEALFLMISSIPEHANYLRNHYSFWGGNHKMTEKMAITICALVWPEFKESKAWLQGALEVMSEELFEQTYSDGSYKELANHYQKVVAENYLLLLRMLDDNPLVNVDEELRHRVESMWNYFAYVTKPSGFGPINNDSSREDNFHFVKEANDYFSRSDWQYLSSHGSSGNKPQSPPSRFFPMAGHAVMRNGWSMDSHWAFFDIGPHGSAHQHWDRLHLSVSIGQQDVLVDSGRYVYKPGPNREYFRYGVGHNLVRIDGQDSLRPPNTVKAPLPVLVQIEDNFDAFAGTVKFKLGFPASEQVNHRRVVVYLRNLGWLILDELVGYGAHQYDTYWNFHPDCLVTQNNAGLDVHLTDQKTVELKLLNPQKNGSWDLARGQSEPEIRGWYSWAYNERLPSTSARYRYPLNQPHVNIWWLAAPTDNTNQHPATAIPSGNPRNLNEVVVKISSAAGEQTIRWQDDHIEVQ